MTPSENFLSSVSIFVGSTEALSKVFLLFFLFSDWLKSNHLNSQIEHGFLNIFAPYLMRLTEMIRVTNYATSILARKNFQKTKFEAAR